MHGSRQTACKKLGAANLVAVVQLLKIVFDPLIPHKRCHGFLAGGQHGRGYQRGFGGEGVVFGAQADGIAVRPAVLQARRPAGKQLGAVLPVAVLAGDIAGGVGGIDAVVLREPGARRPAGIERVKRAYDRHRLALAVGVVGHAVGQLGPAVQRVVVFQLKLVARTVHLVDAAVTHRQAGAQQVVFLDADAARIGPARAGEAGAGVQRPGVARHHLDIDHIGRTAGWRDGAQLHVIQVAVGAQQALGFFHHPNGHCVAGFEQQLAADDLGPRFGVQCVGQAKQGVVLGRVGQIKNVLVQDVDLPDARACGFELGERGGLRQRMARNARARKREQNPQHDNRHQRAANRLLAWRWVQGWRCHGGAIRGGMLKYKPLVSNFGKIINIFS